MRYEGYMQYLNEGEQADAYKKRKADERNAEKLKDSETIRGKMSNKGNTGYKYDDRNPHKNSQDLPNDVKRRKKLLIW